jgi:DNA-binding MarR family transcriptional regulator
MPTDPSPDYISQLGEAFLARRLRRLSDLFVEDIQAFLHASGITCPARSLSTLRLIADAPGLGIVQVARQAQLSHPLVIDLLSQLESLRLVHFVADEKDRRRRLVFLTPDGEAEVARLRDAEPVVRAAYAELSRDIGVDLWQLTDALDAALARRGFLQRLNGVADIRTLLAPRSPPPLRAEG